MGVYLGAVSPREFASESKARTHPRLRHAAHGYRKRRAPSDFAPSFGLGGGESRQRGYHTYTDITLKDFVNGS
jgi:hypothetical protein